MKIYAYIISIAAAMVFFALPLGAQTRTLEDIKAEAKAQVRRELGLDHRTAPARTQDASAQKRKAAPDIPVTGTVRQEDILKIAAGSAIIAVIILGIIFWKPGKKKDKKRTAAAVTEKGPREEDALKKEDSPPATPEKTAPAAGEGETAIDIYDKIERLQQLREKGAITEDEFASKKKELLDRI